MFNRRELLPGPDLETIVRLYATHRRSHTRRTYRATFLWTRFEFPLFLGYYIWTERLLQSRVDHTVVTSGRFDQFPVTALRRYIQIRPPHLPCELTVVTRRPCLMPFSPNYISRSFPRHNEVHLPYSVIIFRFEGKHLLWSLRSGV